MSNNPVGEWVAFVPGSGLPLATGEGGYLKRYLFWEIVDGKGWPGYGYFENGLWYDETMTDSDGVPAECDPNKVTHYCDVQGPKVQS